MSEHSTTPDQFRRVTIVGAGTIGYSWAGLFLAHGLAVTVSDPDPDVQAKVEKALAELTPALAALGLPTQQLTKRLRFVANLEDAVADADVVQENGPERLELKQQIWSVIEDNAPDHALFATSTSTIPATEIATALRQPERLLVGHPFNPPHLVPLVELAPGEKTSAETIELARAFYTSVGKRPQVLRKEVPGFVANRLQSALFREAIHLVSEGVVTEQELDEVVTSSIGMRWAVAGPFRTFHLGGGAGGLPAFLEHLGKALEAQWRVLGTPSLDEPTTAVLREQAEREFGPLSDIPALEDRRDRAQIALMKALAELPASG